MLKIGIGSDTHRLIEGRKCIIGGVDIPFNKGLLGHSDADVLVHAINDAILGAMALGDIGKFFPDTDPEYKDISSLILMKKVARIMHRRGYVISNIDSVITCELPKLAPYIIDMRKNIADVLKTRISRVSIKATTSEGLGYEGRGEGISASAVVMLQKSVSQNFRR